MAELKEYRRKRDSKKTPAPFGSKKRGKEPSACSITPPPLSAFQSSGCSSVSHVHRSQPSIP